MVILESCFRLASGRTFIIYILPVIICEISTHLDVTYCYNDIQESFFIAIRHVANK